MSVLSLLVGIGVLAQEGRWSENPEYVVNDVATIQALEAIIASILGIIVPLVGVVLLVMLILGGFKYITSGGEVEQANQAKKTLTSAIFGLMVVLGAWLIIRLLEEFTGLNLSTFVIPR